MADLLKGVPNGVPSFNLGQEQGQDASGVFKLQSIQQIKMKECDKPGPKPIFGSFAYENEIVLIGGPSNVGKSILAMDLAIVNTSGENYWDKPMANPGKKILYIDTELTDAQFFRRYKDYQCDEQLIMRASFWELLYGRISMDVCLEQIEKLVGASDGPDVIILDNLFTITQTPNLTQTAIRFVQELKRMKELYHKTLVLVSHFNKKTANKPITMDDFRGSMLLTAIADSIIGMGTTQDSGVYIKLLKSRMVKKPETVSVMRIEGEPYVHMVYEGEADEASIIPRGNKRGPAVKVITEDVAHVIYEMHKGGVSLRDIAEATGLSKSTIHRFLNSQNPVSTMNI